MISLKEFKIGISLLLIPAIYTSFFPGKIVIISSICMYTILLFLCSKTVYLKFNNELNNYRIILFYYLICSISFIRGVFNLTSNQDYVVMFSNTIFLMLLYPIFINLIKIENITNLFKSLLIIALPLSFITFFYKPTDGFMSFQHNISFIYIFVFFVPFVKQKWKLIILFLCLITPFSDLTRRSSFVNISFCFLILLFNYILPKYLFDKSIKTLFYLLVTVPVIFLILGLTGVFNIFKLGDAFSEITIKSKSTERNLLVDSRTDIYVDVFSELSRQNAIIFGLGGNGKTKTSLTDEKFSNYDKIYKEGRRGTESGMLNQFQYSGIIGAFSYWLLMTFASFNAVFKSNNKFCMMLGVFLSFKVLFSFIEDQLQPNAASFYLMFIIGICYNFKFRYLMDFQIKKIASKVFN